MNIYHALNCVCMVEDTGDMVSGGLQSSQRDVTRVRQHVMKH